MTTSRSKGKQGEPRRKRSISDNDFIDSQGREVKVEIITGVAPITLLEPTPENLEALQFELLQAEQSLKHYQTKVEGLKKLIGNMKPKITRR